PVTPADTSHKGQQNNNPVVNNNPQQNPTQTNPNPTVDTSHATQPSNPVVVNNPTQNPTQTNPNPTVDTSHATQPSNPVVVNNPTQNPIQTNPKVDTSHATQPRNLVAINNPTQTNPNPTVDTSHATQPSNPVAINNPRQSPVVQQNPAINYSNPQATQSTQSAATFNHDAVTLSAKATDIRNQAKQTTDPEQAKILYHRADSLDDAATEQRVVAALYINNADSSQYSTNQKQLNAWQTAMKSSTSEKVTEAQSLSLNANGYYDQYVKERQKADNTTMPEVKQQYLANASHFLDTAIEKQQQAHDIMLAVNPDLKNVTPSNVVDTTPTQPSNPVVINNPTQTNPSVDTGHATQPSNPVVINNPTQNPTQTNPNTDTSHTTQPSNPVVINNPTQTNPSVDTTHKTQPNNPVVINNPTQTNPSIDTTHKTQPNNPVIVNNPTQTNPSIDTTHKTQPSNPVVVNNPTQTNPSVDTTHKKQPSNPVAINNPSQTNPTVTNPNAGHQTQPENNGLVNFPQLYQHNNVEDITESATPVYSEAHPIPINPPLPEGLVYKVQIGAFKKPIKQTAFKGLEPIAGETTGKGYTRYTAGIFRDLGKANNAKNRVHKIGYRDAFVVAFYNGKRISMKQADALKNNNTQPTQATQPVAVNNNTPPVNTHSTNNNPTAETNPPTLAPEQGKTAKSIPVNEVKGLFYTVQVGAYKTPVTADKLSNLSPLFSCSSPDGNIRYNCGIYSDVPKASAAKDVIVGKTSIKDAFVVAYYNGKRITLAEAAKLLSDKNASISQRTELDKTPNNSSETPPVSQLPKSVFDTTAFPEGSIFTVQIADFIGEESHDEEGKVLGIAIKNGITIHKASDGRTTYTVGRFERYKSADSMKTILERGDVPSLKVVEYINNQPVDYEGAPNQT
ncbi:MAG TPA: hypothetical protein VN922_12040, partial [Bacteroidia bacterium]|nr:hypothetical protein [Bacteroidia bacterium]